MSRDNETKRRFLFAALIVASLVLLTVFLREPASGTLHALRDKGAGSLTPLQSLATRAVKPFRDGYQYVGDLTGAMEENRDLKREMESLRGRVIELDEAKEENDRLKQALDFRNADIFPDGSRFVTARVIGWSPTRWQEWVRIDRGSAQGVKLNSPVVGVSPSLGDSLYGKGLVGKVVAVGENSALVQLIIDAESSVAAVAQGTRAQGIVEGTASGKLVMDYVERDQPVEVKKVVITSGSGQIYPKGIPVGIVESVGEEDVNIYKRIELRAFVDYSALEEVMVIVIESGSVQLEEQMDSVAPNEETGSGSGR